MSRMEFKGLPEGVNAQKLELWLERIAEEYARTVKHLVFTFVEDAAILDINRRFLNHDYYTDIITFDYNTAKGAIKGEVYISLDTVKSNAEEQATVYRDELMRVIAHGLLHLIGFKDKSTEEQAIMRKEEDFCLLLRPEKLMEQSFT